MLRTHICSFLYILLLCNLTISASDCEIITTDPSTPLGKAKFRQAFSADNLETLCQHQNPRDLAASRKKYCTTVIHTSKGWIEAAILSRQLAHDTYWISSISVNPRSKPSKTIKAILQALQVLQQPNRGIVQFNIALDPTNNHTRAIIAGLEKMGFRKEKVFTTLTKQINPNTNECTHPSNDCSCNLGSKIVCKAITQEQKLDAFRIFTEPDALPWFGVTPKEIQNNYLDNPACQTFTVHDIDTYEDGSLQSAVGALVISGIHSKAPCIQLIAVKKNHRRQGFASALLEAIQAFSSNSQPITLEINSLKTNQAAIACYQRNGFTRKPYDLCRFSKIPTPPPLDLLQEMDTLTSPQAPHRDSQGSLVEQSPAAFSNSSGASFSKALSSPYKDSVRSA